MPQIKDNSRFGKGPTAAEFKDVLKFFRTVAEAEMKEVCRVRQERFFDNTPVYSFDCWSGHNVAAELGIVEGDIDSRAPLTPFSPDMHKVIEHVFNRVDHRFGEELWLGVDVDDINVYAECVTQILFTFDPESIRKDIRSLKGTYRDIIAHQGELASPGFN